MSNYFYYVILTFDTTKNQAKSMTFLHHSSQNCVRNVQPRQETCNILARLNENLHGNTNFMTTFEVK